MLHPVAIAELIRAKKTDTAPRTAQHRPARPLSAPIETHRLAGPQLSDQAEVRAA